MAATDQHTPPGSSNSPTVVQQTTVIQVGSRKSVGGAIALAFLLGPIGMLYSTVLGACVMFVVNLFMLVGTGGIGLIVTVPIGMIWAGSAASSHNKGLGIATQAVAQQMGGPPAGWHADPNGSGRLRYWDGQSWTDHYSPPQTSAVDNTALPLTASPRDIPGGVEECNSCGEEISRAHKFCPSCGAASTA